MSEKYKIIYSADKNLYTEGAPVIIAEGGLVRDIKNGNMFCQLRLVNIINKTIKSVVGKAITDIAVAEGGVDGLVCVRDMDLTLNIPLEGYDHKSVRFEINTVSFTDGSMWSPSEGAVWSTLAAPQTLEEYLGDDDLVREVKSHFEDGIYFPTEEIDLRYCTCGALNHADETACHVCNRTFYSLKKYGVSELKNAVDKQKRLDAINKDVFDDAYRSVEADRKSRKNRSLLYLFIAILIITIIAWLIVSDGNHYTTAI